LPNVPRIASYFLIPRISVDNTHVSSQGIPATLIPGDGIGPEIMDATLRVLEALAAPFDWDVQNAGMSGVKECGDPLPPAVLESIRRTGPRA
jgi:isocitrate dehydrogenase (NAD+)